MKKVLFCLILFPLQLSAYTHFTLMKLYADADYVAHVRLGESGPENSFSEDMGTTWYRVSFSTLEVYKQRDTQNLQEYYFVHYGYEVPDPGLFLPGKELIVFLKRNGLTDDPTYCEVKLNPWEFTQAVAIKGGIWPYTRQLGMEIINFGLQTSFDRAVTKGQWTRVTRIIKQQIRKAARENREEPYQGIEQVNEWLLNHNTVDQVAVDSCAAHIDIWPGWTDTGIRFLTRQGPREFRLTIASGKTVRWKYWLRWVGISPMKDRNVFRSLAESPEVLFQINTTCQQYYFERMKGWKPQQDLEIKITPLSDTLVLFPGVAPLIRVKVVMLNRSAEPLNILWPEEQTQGYPILRFCLTASDGRRMEEETMVEMLQRNESIWPVIRQVMPGDSLVAWHSINDPYGFSSDISSNHTIPYVNEDNFMLSVLYEPKLDGDTSLYWNPVNGSREVFYPKALTAFFPYVPTDTFLCNIRMIERGGGYTNAYGQRCLFNGLGTVLEAPAGSGIVPGDTIAYRFPYTIWDPWTENPSRPAYDAELAQPDDILQLKVNGSFPVDRFSKSGTGKMGNFLLINEPDAVKILSH